jgi:formamidopyrimidine-DNA glycosylase
MPELPEVETLCRQLKKVILGEVIEDVKIIDPKLEMISDAIGKCITAVTRRGKALEIHIDSDKAVVLHLRMTGRLLWQDDRQVPPPHSRFMICFAKGSLVCIDPRRFATLRIDFKPLPRHSRDGVVIEDPLHRFPADRLEEMARIRKLPVKSFLMDQRVILGIGNIYACELLYEASVHPWRKVCSLSIREWENIERATAVILKKAVACRGTTVSDWRDLFGVSGEYQHELKVYARNGYPCQRCSGVIGRERLGGRGTYFCPSCQK